MLGLASTGKAIVVADLEAGIGTLTRLGDASVDVVLVVVEPTPKSIEVGSRAAALAQGRAFPRLVVVANRVRGEDDLVAVRKAFPAAEIVVVPDDPAIVEADRDGVAALDAAAGSPAVRALVDLGRRLAPTG